MKLKINGIDFEGEKSDISQLLNILNENKPSNIIAFTKEFNVIPTPKEKKEFTGLLSYGKKLPVEKAIEARELIKKMIDTGISMTEIAKVADVHSNTLSRPLHHDVGISERAYFGTIKAYNMFVNDIRDEKYRPFLRRKRKKGRYQSGIIMPKDKSDEAVNKLITLVNEFGFSKVAKALGSSTDAIRIRLRENLHDRMRSSLYNAIMSIDKNTLTN